MRLSQVRPNAKGDAECWRHNVVLADVNADGTLEMITGPRLAMRMRDGDLFKPRGYSEINAQEAWQVADVDQDGNPDAIGYTWHDSGPLVYDCSGDGRLDVVFSSRDRLWFYRGGASPSSTESS